MGPGVQSTHHIGQRLSLKSSLCTVRYIGPIAGRSGQYLGVEWDDPERGKHAGSYDGTSYFTCRNGSPTAASFLKPEQTWDRPRTFLEAVREKYMSEDDSSSSSSVYFSGKEAEQIGFHKFAQRQKQLLGIHVLVLEGLRVHHRATDDDAKHITEVCAEIRELDMTSNLLESFGEILDLVRRMPKLKALTLDRNRFEIDSEGKVPLPNLRQLNLRHCLLRANEVSAVTSQFPSLEALSLGDNTFANEVSLDLPSAIKSLDFTSNQFVSISQVRLDGQHDRMHALTFKRNMISTVGQPPACSASITDLDLSYNDITTWAFLNDLDATFPNLKTLRVTGNPLYANLTSADGKPLAAEVGYMLTIARLPGLETLNYSKITDKEKLNAETYYLSQIALELSLAAQADWPKILAQHPRYPALVEEYGEPTVHRQAESDGVDPNSLAARFLDITFILTPETLPTAQVRTWKTLVPKSATVYMLLGQVAKRLNTASHGFTPLDIRLVLETSEDVLADGQAGYAGVRWWDSEDEDAEEELANGQKAKWVKREVEMLPGTRLLAPYIDGRAATIRIELRKRSN